MSSTPISCSLGADALAERIAAWRALGEGALLSRSATPGTVTAVFARRPDVERELHRLVAAEADCCGFLDLRVTTGADTLTLTATAPPEAAGVLSAFAGAPPAG